MRIGIIGVGKLGSVLARRLRDLGHTVLIANSRGPETLSPFAAEVGAVAVSVSEAASNVDVLVLSIPLINVLSLPSDLLAPLPASVPIVDTCNYYPPRDGRIREIDAGQVESEWTSEKLRRPVIRTGLRFR